MVMVSLGLFGSVLSSLILSGLVVIRLSRSSSCQVMVLIVSRVVFGLAFVSGLVFTSWLVVSPLSSVTAESVV